LASKGCEVAKKYSEFIKSILKVSLDNNKELGVIFCKKEKGSEVIPAMTSIGTESMVAVPSCPAGAESVGMLHTHVDLDFFSAIDYLTFAAKDDDFSCIAYYGDDGEPYVKCIHRPKNIGEWIKKLNELEQLEYEASHAYELYQVAMANVLSAIEEEGEVPEGKSELVKVFRERLSDYNDKFEKLRKKAIELETDACVVKL